MTTTQVADAIHGFRHTAGQPDDISTAFVPVTISTSGHPTTGTWVTHQSVIDSAGLVWNCTAGGTPGTWVAADAALVNGLVSQANLPAVTNPLLGFVLPNTGETQTYYKVAQLPIYGVACSRLAPHWSGFGMWGSGIMSPAAGAGQAIVVVPPLFGAAVGGASSGVTSSPQGPADSSLGTGTASTLLITSVSGTVFSFSYNSGAVSSTKFAWNSNAAAIQTALNSTAGVTGATVTASTTANTFLITFPAASAITPSLLTTTVAGTLSTGANMTLPDVAAGIWDAMFTPCFAMIAAFSPTTIIKIGDEMYGNWYPWASSANAVALTAAYQHLVTLARVSSATFKFDWSGAMNFLGYDPMTFTGAYPGDTYVDYVSADYYDGLANQGSPSSGHISGAADWAYFVTHYATEGLAFAAAHGKPYCLSEWGLGQSFYSTGAMDDPTWITAAYAWMRANAQKLGYLLYFQDDTDGWTGGLQLNPNSAAVFTTLFGGWAQNLAGIAAARAQTPSTRTTVGPPVVLYTDQAGDFATDTSAGISYGPLTGTPVIGAPWNNPTHSQANILSTPPPGAAPVVITDHGFGGGIFAATASTAGTSRVYFMVGVNASKLQLVFTNWATHPTSGAVVTDVDGSTTITFNAALENPVEQVGLLTSATINGSITSFAVSPLNIPIALGIGTIFTITDPSGSPSQTFVTTGSTAIGATTVTVTSKATGAIFPIGSKVTANVVKRVTFGGLNTATLNPGGQIISDPVAMDVTQGQVLYARTFLATGTAYARQFIWGSSANTAATGFTSATDLTAPGSVPVTIATGYIYGPSCVIGLPTPGANPLSVLLQGDSIGLGNIDGSSGGTNSGFLPGPNAAALSRGGFVERALVGVGGLLGLACGSDSLALFTQPNGHYRRMTLANLARFGFIQYGINDFYNMSQSAVQTETNLIAQAIRNQRNGLRKSFTNTITPNTTSTDNWITYGNQTQLSSTFNTQRQAYNLWLRAGCPIDPTSLAPVAVGTGGALLNGQPGHPITAVCDVAATVEQGGAGAPTGLWLTPAIVITDCATTSGAFQITSAGQYVFPNLNSPTLAANQAAILTGASGLAVAIIGGAAGSTLLTSNYIVWGASNQGVLQGAAAGTTASGLTAGLGITTWDGIHMANGHALAANALSLMLGQFV